MSIDGEDWTMLEINKIYAGDALTVLKTFPGECVNMCMTSPSYWALRDYGVDGQLGLEPTFDLYINHLCDIFDEMKRVLRADGTCWVVIGDTYNGSGGCGWAGLESKNWEQKAWPHKIKTYSTKCLCQIPARFSIEMINRGWILRNDIIWHKRNCMPSSAKDRFTVDYEHLFFFSKSRKYYFEQQFDIATTDLPIVKKKTCGHGAVRPKDEPDPYGSMGYSGNGQKNKRCVWTISTKPSKEPHFATYPPELCLTPIRAGCPEGGTVLDPFSGTGTTAMVAINLNRNYIGIELNPKDVERSTKKLKNVTRMML